MYKRDVAVVVISFLALFLCLQHEGNFSFHKAWYHVTLQDPGRALRGLQDRLEELPPPLVTDLNGDGGLEVVVATHELRLQLLRPEPAGRAGEGFAPVEVVRSFDLLPAKVAVGRDRRPVAMAAGFIDPEPAEKVRPPRKQVLVVVTAAWEVLCFDHNLALLWEATVHTGGLPRNARPDEVAVLISAHAVRKGDRGLVVVGGSLELGDVAGAAVGAATVRDGGADGGGNAGGGGGGGGEGQLLEGVLKEELRFEAEEAAHAHGGAGLTGRVVGAPDGDGGGGGDAPGARGGVDVSRHFSYWAFEGGRGEQAWTHSSGAFTPDEVHAAAGELRPQDDFRLRADALNGRHFGEVSCREFRESVLASLPQLWSAPRDTRLEEALFVKHKEGAGQQKQQLAKLAAAKAASGGRASHSSLHPRNKRGGGGGGGGGLFSLAHILGPSRRGGGGGGKGSGRARGLVASKHADAYEAAHAGPAHRHAHLAHNASANAVVAHVRDGVEAIHLFSGRTLCKLHLPPGQLHADVNGDGVIDHVQVGGGAAGLGPLGNSGGSPRHHAGAGPCTATATSGIPPTHALWQATVCDAQRGLHAALDGLDAGRGARPPKFAPPAFLPVPRADGSYSHLRGQHGVVVVLSDDGVVTALNGRGERLWTRVYDVAWATDDDEAPVVPTLLPLALRPHAVPAALLIVGADGAAVVSEHGNELAAFSLAFPPVAPAVVADFDGDGLSDVIIVTRGGVFGYAQVQHLGGLSFGALLLALIVAMAVVWWNQQYDAGGSLLLGAAAAVLPPGALGAVGVGGGLGYGGGGLLGGAPSAGAGMYGDSRAVGVGGIVGTGTAAARARKLRSTEAID